MRFLQQEDQSSKILCVVYRQEHMAHMILPEDFYLEKYGLEVRLVKNTDAKFIVDLRTDPDLCRYIHEISKNIEDQIAWLNTYKERERNGRDYYFIFSIDQKPLGTERIYNVNRDSFTTGSWLFSKNAPFGASVRSDIITREIGFDLLGYDVSYFDVMKENKIVISYHERYRPVLYKEDENSRFYKLSRNDFSNYKTLYLKMLNCL